MQAVTFQSPHELKAESVPEPKLQQPTDAIVRVSATAVCGSDLHVYRGAETGLDRGTIMGHEFVGEIIEAGADVKHARGTRVVSPFTTSCGACYFCERGLTARCEQGELFGWVEGGQGLHGGQCEYVRVPLANSTLMTVPDGLDEEVALFAGDIYSTGAFCVEGAGVDATTTVAVIGCGPVGLMAILDARERGAAQVFAVDAIPERLELARSFGATPLSFQTDDVPAAIRAATDGRGADAVCEVVGHPSATRLAYDIVRFGGRISAAGVHTEQHFAFSPGEAYDKNITYYAGRCSARSQMPASLDKLTRVGQDVARIITHRIPLSEGADAYKMFDQKLDGCIKILLETS